MTLKVMLYTVFCFCFSPLSFIYLLIRRMCFLFIFIVDNSMALCSRKVDKADRGDRERTLLTNVNGPVTLARHIDLGNNIQSLNSAGRGKTWKEIVQYTFLLSLNIDYMHVVVKDKNRTETLNKTLELLKVYVRTFITSIIVHHQKIQ